MTGKELIMYILENDLLDENVINNDGVPIFLLSVDDAAEKFDVGPITIKVWAGQGNIASEEIEGGLYIYETAEDPRK